MALQVPGRIDVKYMMRDGALVHPIVNTAQERTGGIMNIVNGGLTKVEFVAAAIVAQRPHMGVAEAIDVAEAILAECATRRAPATPTEGD